MSRKKSKNKKRNNETYLKYCDPVERKKHGHEMEVLGNDLHPWWAGIDKLMPMDRNWSITCFWTARKLKMVFTFLFCWKKIFHGTWKLGKIKVSVSINKALLKHNHIRSFMILLWLLSRFKGRVEHLWQRLYGTLCLNYLLSSTL